MIFQLRTDNHIQNSEEFAAVVRDDVQTAFGDRFGERLRRVEVYLEDVNGNKRGMDIRATIEVHLAGRPAVTATEVAADIDTGVDGALNKVLRVLEHQLGREEGRAGHVSAAGEAL